MVDLHISVVIDDAAECSRKLDSGLVGDGEEEQGGGHDPAVGELHTLQVTAGADQPHGRSLDQLDVVALEHQQARIVAIEAVATRQDGDGAGPVEQG